MKGVLRTEKNKHENAAGHVATPLNINAKSVYMHVYISENYHSKHFDKFCLVTYSLVTISSLGVV